MYSCGFKSDLKTAKIALITISLYLLSWTPYATVAFLSLIGKARPPEPVHLGAPGSGRPRPRRSTIRSSTRSAIRNFEPCWKRNSLGCCAAVRRKLSRNVEATSSAGSKFSRRDTRKRQRFPSQRAPEDGAAAPPAITEGKREQGLTKPTGCGRSVNFK
uniref:G_PROTEIN_RECEP_F1_2 domain-containing protein n=1 Tax=Macrostomum lignano TaxID=282301 RepID=A0A1I8FLC7_9PLAT